MVCPDLLVQAPHVRSDWACLCASELNEAAKTLDGTYMCEFAVGRFAGVALIPPTNRLALELVGPVLRQGVGL